MTQQQQQPTLLQLSQQAQQTLKAMACQAQGSCLRPSPLCCEDTLRTREVRGWVLDTPLDACALALPLSYTMFDGMSLLRCEASEVQILELMRDEAGTRRRLGEAVAHVQEALQKAPDMRASWNRCAPTDSSYPFRLDEVIVNPRTKALTFARPTDTEVPRLDGAPWLPELSPEGFVGLFQHYHHGPHRRGLQLYAVCQSYLPKPCLEYADTVQRVGELNHTAYEVASSYETQWLRDASSRNRRRILAQASISVCTELGLPFAFEYDYHHSTTKSVEELPRMANCCSETLHHDLCLLEEQGMVRVLNYCTETQRSDNGYLCHLNPWDGLWIFHGQDASASPEYEFGVRYGTSFLPTAAPRLADGCVSLPHPFTVATANLAECRCLQVGHLAAAAFDSSSSTHQQQQQQHTTHALLGIMQGHLQEELEDMQSTEAFLTQAGEELDSEMLTACRAVLDHKQREARRLAVLRSRILTLQPAASTTATTTAPVLAQEEVRHYFQFDEALRAALAQRGWERAHGFTELFPMAVALAEWLPSQAGGAPI